MARIRADRPGYAHLPSCYRALRHCWVALDGGAPTAIARKKLNMPGEWRGDAAAAAVRLETLRKQAVEWFEAEVRLRGGEAQVVRDARNETVSWDPHALAELLALLIDTSVDYAELVRIGCSKGSVDDATLVERVKQAFGKDGRIKELLAKYHCAPDIELADSPKSQGRKSLVLRFAVRFANRPDVVVLSMAMPRGAALSRAPPRSSRASSLPRHAGTTRPSKHGVLAPTPHAAW